MSTATLVENREIALLRQQARAAHRVVRLNLDGLTHEETLIQPAAGGNCLNWVVGHLLAIYHKALPLLGQDPVMSPRALERYDRGSAPLRDGGDAIDIADLLAAWDETSRRVDAGLAAFDVSTLGDKAPFSPSNNPNETMGSLLATVAWHQAYHTGQTGLLRRIAGRKDGGIP